jgi:hypothetical protein
MAVHENAERHNGCQPIDRVRLEKAESIERTVKFDVQNPPSPTKVTVLAAQY